MNYVIYLCYGLAGLAGLVVLGIVIIAGFTIHLNCQLEKDDDHR